MQQNEAKSIREPEVPGREVPAVERRDGPARITSEELAITHFENSGTLQNAWFYKTKRLSVWGKVLIRTSSG